MQNKKAMDNGKKVFLQQQFIKETNLVPSISKMKSVYKCNNYD